MFQLMTTVGIAVAQLVNLGTAKADFGWRVSLALAGVPAIALTLAGLFLPDTPNSLAARGKPQEARRVLARLRGTEEVDAEFDDIQAAVKASAAMKGGWKTLFTKRCRCVGEVRGVGGCARFAAPTQPTLPSPLP
jgi:hypothetical protein